ncbi:MAG: InlB B-repeat-containing protein [Chitinispirillales bacterium]|jgi:uncharacterized repeat protein (TIGR02543 family)|nr:InlB B-repeat-containing protein [Chitinispirillales bacterium]
MLKKDKFLKVMIAAVLFFTACSDVDKGDYTIFSHCTVSFNTQLGDDCPPISKKSGENIILPMPSKRKYTFDGWYNAGLGGAFLGDNGDGYTVTGSITMYAHWIKRISFDTQGGDNCPAKTEQYGKNIKLPKANKSGYVFDGWYDAITGGTKAGNADALYMGDEDMNIDFNGDITLYAHWAQRISFDAQGGTACTTITVAAGSSVTLPATSKANYTLDGWYDAVTGGTKAGGANASYTHSGNITLYAQWIPNEYTITFDVQGGSGCADKPAKYGESVSLPSSSKEGFVFQGWFTAAAGGAKAGDAFALYSVTGNVTLYARWGL